MLNIILEMKSVFSLQIASETLSLTHTSEERNSIVPVLSEICECINVVRYAPWHYIAWYILSLKAKASWIHVARPTYCLQIYCYKRTPQYCIVQPYEAKMLRVVYHVHIQQNDGLFYTVLLARAANHRYSQQINCVSEAWWHRDTLQRYFFCK